MAITVTTELINGGLNTQHNVEWGETVTLAEDVLQPWPYVTDITESVGTISASLPMAVDLNADSQASTFIVFPFTRSSSSNAETIVPESVTLAEDVFSVNPKYMTVADSLSLTDTHTPSATTAYPGTVDIDSLLVTVETDVMPTGIVSVGDITLEDPFIVDGMVALDGTGEAEALAWVNTVIVESWGPTGWGDAVVDSPRVVITVESDVLSGLLGTADFTFSNITVDGGSYEFSADCLLDEGIVVEADVTDEEGGVAGAGQFVADLTQSVITVESDGITSGGGEANIILFGASDGPYVSAAVVSLGWYGTLEIPPPYATASGVSGGVSTVDVTFSLPTVDALFGDMDITSTSDIQIGLIALDASCGQLVNGSAPDLYEITYTSMNLKTAAVTEYTDHSYRRILTTPMGLVGVSSDGIFVLGGETDNGEPITVHLRKVYVGGDGAFSKRMSEAYFHVESTGDVTAEFLGDEGEVSVVSEDTRSTMHTKKFHAPRGMKGRRIGVGLRGDGTISRVDGLEMLIDKLDRRNR